MDLRDSNGGSVKGRPNIGLQVFESAQRDTTHSSADLQNVSARGVQLIIDVTAEDVGTSSHSMIVTIQGKCPVSGKYYELLASAAITATGTTVLTVYPGLTASANAVANNVLPREWNVKVDHTQAGTSNMTYSIGANLVN